MRSPLDGKDYPVVTLAGLADFLAGRGLSGPSIAACLAQAVIAVCSAPRSVHVQSFEFRNERGEEVRAAINLDAEPALR